MNYDRYKTQGMTTEDMIEAISATYGPAAASSSEVLFPSAYSEKVKVIARWEDSENSLNLIRSPFQPGFALISFSKQLDSLAQAAVIESIRLDTQEAPQKAAELKQRLADAVSAKEEKARPVNKVGFRP